MSIQAEKMRIDHIITGLDVGGAEMMLYKLLKTFPADAFSFRVISLTNNGPVGRMIEGLGIPVIPLNMSSRMPNPLKILQLATRIKKKQTQIVQTWMYHADLLGGLAARVAGAQKIVWGIHNSTLDREKTKWMTRLTVRLNARLSHWLPDKIISCSKSAEHLHVNLGFPSEKMVVIPNGFDLDQFQPDDQARYWLREELGVSSDAQIISHVARFDPQKDYATLISAAEKLLNEMPRVHWVLCGRGVDSTNAQLTTWIAQKGLSPAVHLLGQREDIPRIMAGSNLLTLTSSYGEAFPNVIGEAMACGVPCVVTDVGDSGVIVGDTGIVVPPGSSSAIAQGWKRLLSMPVHERNELGQKARERIIQNYSIKSVSDQYIETYRNMLYGKNPFPSNPGGI